MRFAELGKRGAEVGEGGGEGRGDAENGKVEKWSCPKNLVGTLAKQQYCRKVHSTSIFVKIGSATFQQHPFEIPSAPLSRVLNNWCRARTPAALHMSHEAVATVWP